ncbi:DUF2169 family type VI secretion system accessory protein [Sorangium sp. So ce1182]|uniref:DUF2169 family type VI secretion system accessory protein n=1 Tax=Sorangium sp. So ce1182 TaxID=3133334 RepID=UPI003F61A7E0
MSLINYTTQPADAALLYDRLGRTLLVVAVKASRKLRSPEEEHADPLPVHKTDVMFPGGALRYPGDLPAGHPGTDIICHGNIHAHGGRATYEARAELQVGHLRAAVVARGARKLARRLVGLTPSEPEPFVTMPLSFDRAFGGPYHAANPIGVGDFTRVPMEDREGRPLPTIEWDGTPPRDSRGGSPPPGFSAIARSWQPRCLFAGTYDDAWRRTRAPLLPLDFDERFHVAANAGLWSSDPLRGGEPLELRGLTPEGRLVTKLPRMVFGVRIGDHWQRPQLDLVVLEPDDNRVSLTYRAAADVSNRVERLPKVRIIQKRLISAAREDA